MDFLFSSVWGWIGAAGAIVIACVAVGYFFPQFRVWALAIGGGAIYAASVYTKGSRDQAARDKKRSDEAAKKVQADYARIDSRNDTPADVAKRLRDGQF